MKRKEEAPIAEKKPRVKKAAKVVGQPKPVPVLNQGILFSARDLSGTQLDLFGDDRIISLS
ncbi:MAG: hypothetical protein LBK43_03210 [Treponema sp.]|nr:hypothetical protein [Treponema sp.]